MVSSTDNWLGGRVFVLLVVKTRSVLQNEKQRREEGREKKNNHYIPVDRLIFLAEDHPLLLGKYASRFKKEKNYPKVSQNTQLTTLIERKKCLPTFFDS